MQKTCANGWCKQSFEVTGEDLAFYDQISPVFAERKYPIPPPSVCPDCRRQRLLSFRSERSFYRRTCDATKKQVVSIYKPDNGYTVYDQPIWWGDSWEGLEYGRPMDFSRSFFEQYAELWHSVPLLAMWNINAENAEFNNNSMDLKDCYMNANTDFCRNAYYSYVCEYCDDCVDCGFIHHSELCYECLDCRACYACWSCRECEDCRDCAFSSDCIGCTQCIGCHGLRHKDLHVCNVPVSVEEWTELAKRIHSDPAAREEVRKRSEAVRLKIPHRAAWLVQCEDCTGDHLHHCRKTTDCFDCVDVEDSRRVAYVPLKAHHVHDAYAFGGVTWAYELLGAAVAIERVAFIWNTSNGLNNAYYCALCLNGSSDCFGCVGLKKKSYCVLNTQYTKEEYETLVPKIIDHMRKTGEWGGFFPSSISPFGYNETVAQEEFPLEKAQALARGFRWSDYEPPRSEATKIIPAAQLPSSIDDVSDDIVHWTIECDATKRPFKIIKQELDFYRQMHLPVPHFHPDERHRQRMALRNPRRLWNRQCAKCQKSISTSYAPDRPEIVYCEDCYLKEVY